MMRRSLVGWPVVVLVAVLIAFPAHAQRGGGVEGSVTSEGRPVPGVTIRARCASLGTVTDAAGRYRIPSGLPPGPCRIQADVLGMQPLVQELLVVEGRIGVLDFVLRESAIALEALEVIVGSRAQHTAADELAVPVDVFPREVIRAQGTMETATILSQVAPSVNFPRHSVSDASDVVRPFTLRGLSPDQTLVLVNGKRYHRTALVHIYGAGMGAGSSGVDMNTLPASAVERLEVLRDGAAAQYGSDAIAGVVNVVLRRGAFGPDLMVDVGRYQPDEWDADGRTLDVAGGWGIPVGRGSVAVFAEYRDREPTNRACPDWEDQLTPGDADEVVDCALVGKNNPVPQPTYHWGDGAQRDILTFANALVPLTADATTQVYAFGGFAYREGVGQGYFRHGGNSRNWTEIYPFGFLPEFRPDVKDAHASAGVRGLVGGWTYDLGGTLGLNDFRYEIGNSLNTSLGPCLDTPCAPGLDGVMGTGDDPGIPNQTVFYAGSLRLSEVIGSLDLSRGFDWGLAGPVNVAAGASLRRETYEVVAGEPASWMQGGHPDRNGDIAPAGSQVFPGFRPENEADADRTNVGVYVDLESDIARGVLANVAARYERYSDFGDALTGKLALRWQPSERVTVRGALSTGFRAPSLSQSWYGSTVTNFEIGEDGSPVPFDVGIFPVGSEAAQALGATPLREETSRNASAGIAFTPVERLNFTADYYFIDLDHRIMLTTELGGDEVAAILASRGLQATAARYFTNAIHSRTQGVDVTAGYRFPAFAAGALSIEGIFNYTETEIVDAIPLPDELEGTGAVLFDPFGEGGLLALEKERPKWRSTLSGRYDRGPFGVLLRASLYGSYTSSLYGYTEESVQEYGEETLFDAELGWRFMERGRIAVGARNLFDNYPDRMSADNGFDIFPYPPASPFGYNGRYIYTRLEVGLGR